MHVLVTGGAGHLGRAVCARLTADGHAVRVYDNFSSGSRARLEDADGTLVVVEGDVRDGVLLAEALQGIDAVLHLAARVSVAETVADPAGTGEVNAAGTLSVLEACRDAGIPRMVFASSSLVQSTGSPAGARVPTYPDTPYGVQKLTAEQYCRFATSAWGLEAVVVRLPEPLPGAVAQAASAEAVSAICAGLVSDER